MKKIIFLSFLITLLTSHSAYSMSFFNSILRPAPSEPNPPEPKPPEPKPPEPKPEPKPPEPKPPEPSVLNVFLDIAQPIGQSVDDYYSNYRELSPDRANVSNHATDFCPQDLNHQRSFSDRIAYYVNEHTKKTRPHLAQLAPFYSVPSQLNQHIEMSLTSHPLCRVTHSTLSQTIGAQRVPNQTVINQLDQFSRKHNSLRQRVINDQDIDAEIELNQLWTRFMSCLSYTESLTTADINSSRSVASRYAPNGYTKPSGVKFYEDPLQPQVSRLNIGLFQFTPNAGGNINPCIRHWNEKNSSCQISRSSSQSELIRILGSGYQTFNAFCGVNKILQTFSIQANTSSTNSTHPDNFQSGMKAPQNRCVTPFFWSGRAYNHFGPLMNTTGSNLGSLMRCVLR